jgi:Cu-processing system permease protein
MSSFGIARLVIKQRLRAKLVFVPLLLGCLGGAVPFYIRLLSLNQGGFSRLSQDAVIGLMSFACFFLATVLGSGSLAVEIDKKQIFALLSRPISRLNLILGHFLGNLVFVALCALIMTATLATSLAYLGADFRPWNVSCAGYGCFLAGMVTLALATFCSTRCSPPLTAVICTFVWCVGGLSDHFIEFVLEADRNDHIMSQFVQMMKALLPQYELFNLQQAAVHNLWIEPGYSLALSFYGLVWAGFFLLLSELSLAKRDF